jgi:hypothetical protein
MISDFCWPPPVACTSSPRRSFPLPPPLLFSAPPVKCKGSRNSIYSSADKQSVSHDQSFIGIISASRFQFDPRIIHALAVSAPVAASFCSVMLCAVITAIRAGIVICQVCSLIHPTKFCFTRICLPLIAYVCRTHGESWLINSNWIISQNYCEWFGVTCDAGGNITTVLSYSFFGTCCPSIEPHFS